HQVLHRATQGFRLQPRRAARADADLHGSHRRLQFQHAARGLADPDAAHVGFRLYRTARTFDGDVAGGHLQVAVAELAGAEHPAGRHPATEPRTCGHVDGHLDRGAAAAAEQGLPPAGLMHHQLARGVVDPDLLGGAHIVLAVRIGGPDLHDSVGAVRGGDEDVTAVHGDIDGDRLGGLERVHEFSSVCFHPLVVIRRCIRTTGGWHRLYVDVYVHARSPSLLPTNGARCRPPTWTIGPAPSRSRADRVNW